jgi:hypothetical protein
LVSPVDLRIYPASYSSYSDESKVDVDSLGREIGDVSGSVTHDLRADMAHFMARARESEAQTMSAQRDQTN